ncbi:MAG TPA: hypothetical protein ENF81_08250 [Thermotogaceae bacterium]|nr:hypothetical protein [Thermotogaceae bacterium]
MNDVTEKLSKMLEILKEEYDAEYKSIETEYKNKFEDVKKKIERELEEYREKRLSEAKTEADNIIKVAESKAELILRQERLKLKNLLFEKILAGLKRQLLNLPMERKKYFYQKLYLDADKIMDEDYTVVCNPNDKEMILEIVSSKVVETDESIEGGIVLRGEHVSIRNTVDSFLEENKAKIFALILEEVGELQ